MWNAALKISYTHPMVGRETEALEVFSDGLVMWGKLAADGKCAEPEVFHHLVGGGMPNHRLGQRGLFTVDGLIFI